MQQSTNLKITELNPHITCSICHGYLVDATTILRCLHSFCRSCIRKCLKVFRYCPVCDKPIHKTNPLSSCIKYDKTLQDLVYKLVPGLYQDEMKRRRKFYADHLEAAAGCSPEQRGQEFDKDKCLPNDYIRVSLEYRSRKDDAINADKSESGEKETKVPQMQYLYCPASFTVGHLIKYVREKEELPQSYLVEIYYSSTPLQLLKERYKLMDIAFNFTWIRSERMEFFYEIKKLPKQTLIPSSTVEIQQSASTSGISTKDISGDIN